MEVKVIRGYKLKLWKDRLDLAPEFIEMIDLGGMNLVHQEFPSDGPTTIILFTRLKGQSNPIPVKMTLSEDELESISERVNLNDRVENSSNRKAKARTDA